MKNDEENFVAQVKNHGKTSNIVAKICQVNT
jgi:hypothetical protein